MRSEINFSKIILVWKPKISKCRESRLFNSGKYLLINQVVVSLVGAQIIYKNFKRTLKWSSSIIPLLETKVKFRWLRILMI